MTRSHHSHTTAIPRGRLSIIIGVVFVFGGLLSYRLADLQILRAAELSAAAALQHGTVRTITAERGKIFIGEYASDTKYPVATNRAFNHVYLVPKDIQDTLASFNALKDLVEPYGLSPETLEYRIGKTNDIYEPLLHKLTQEQLEPFISLGMPGLAWEPEEWRYYPENGLVAHVTGFVGVQEQDRVGQYGLEGFFQGELAGSNGLLEGTTDISGRLLQTGPLQRKESEPGIDLTLTIDRTLQTYACRKLAEQVEAVAAEQGTVIVVNPETGAVLVMCSSPSFDPNNYGDEEDIGVYLNPSIAATYEPGSIFKPFTMAAALNEGVVTAQTTYIDEGVEEIGKYSIRNSDGKAHGLVDMVTVLDESLNTGAIFVQRQLGNEKFLQYMEKFGFGVTTDIELPNELSGNISSLEKRGDIFAATGSFGQGITTTPIQITMAYAAMANGGTLMKPYIIAEKSKGSATITTKPTLVTEVLNPKASTIIGGMLVSVVRAGHAKSAGVPGYYIAGKTGTAQVAEGGQYGQATIHSFAGFGPVDKPVFAMLVKLDKPQYGRFAASTAAPLFGDIAQFIIQYYQVPPDEEI